MKDGYTIGGSIGFVVGLVIFFIANTVVQEINIESGHQIRPLGFYDYAALSGIPISLASLPVIAKGFLTKFNLLFMIGSSSVLVLIWFGILFSIGS